jgi:hypothetical protein
MALSDQNSWPDARRLSLARASAFSAFVLSAIPSYWLLFRERFSVSDRNVTLVVLLLILAWPGFVGGLVVRRHANEAIALFLFSAAGCGFMTVFLFPIPFWAPGLVCWLVSAGIAWGPRQPPIPVDRSSP